jgi:hypothetical protein
VAGGAEGSVGGTAARVKAEMRRLRCSIEPFKQLVENCLGTGGIHHLCDRRDRVQFCERGLYLGIANCAFPRQKRTHSSEL